MGLKNDFVMLERKKVAVDVRPVESLDQCARCTRTASYEILVPWDVFERTGMGTIAAEQIEYLGKSWARFVTCTPCRDELVAR